MTATDCDVLVLGGGVAGLAAAARLARGARRRVTLVEARERLGGRVFTAHPEGWDEPVELGAEFIHEGNDALWRLLREKRIGTRRVPDTHWRHNGTEIVELGDVAAEIAAVTRRIDPKRMRRWSFADFMRREGARLSPEARELALGFVEGFQAAPPDKMSATAMAGESLDTSEQYVVRRGFARLLAAMSRDVARSGVDVRLGSPAVALRWRRGEVVARLRSGEIRARAAIVTLPLGVLKAAPGERGAVEFTPPLRDKQRVLARMQVGHVIRTTWRMDGRRWRGLLPEALRRAGGGFGFIHSRVAGVPVWWALSGRPVLTGWAGGPAAMALAPRPPRTIAAHALSSLAEILGVSSAALRGAVRDVALHNWSSDPLSRGAYSFAAVGAEDAPERLREPVRDTLFFAGEATADGAEVGTVHGALASGLRAAEEVRRALPRA